MSDRCAAGPYNVFQFERTLGAAGGGGRERERDADAAHGQVNDLDGRSKVGRPCHNRVPQIGKNPQESGRHGAC